MIAYYTDNFLILEESSMGHSVSMMNITEMEYALGNTSCHMNVSTQVTLHLDMLLYQVYTVLSYIGEDDVYIPSFCYREQSDLRRIQFPSIHSMISIYIHMMNFWMLPLLVMKILLLY